jgi:hypothetical protein
MIRSSFTERVSVTLRADELALLRAIAAENASTVSALARRAIRRDLQRELALREALARDAEHHDRAPDIARRVADCPLDLWP